MTKTRLDGLTLLLLGTVSFVAMGLLLDVTVPMPFTDFMTVYYPARCLVQHHDPYQVNQVWAAYQAQRGYIPVDPIVFHKLSVVAFTCVNLPPTLALLVPLAVLPWKFATAIWLAVIGGSFALACYRLWNMGADSAPRMYGLLIALVMINSGFLLFAGNSAGLVVSLCIVAACCFVQDRCAWAGVVCMALSILIKPHDAGLVWLYFVLAGGVRRKRALQALALAAMIALPAILWVSHLVPNWLPEYRSNLLTEILPGGISAPGPSPYWGPGLAMIINLQVVFSLIRNNPHFYDPATYAICGAMLILWCRKTVRASFSPRTAWLALAAISAITLLPTYHRNYDARLLLLTIPACVLLWEKGGPMGWLAMLFTCSGIVITGDLFWIFFFSQVQHLARAKALGMAVVPLTLLAISVFYLWAYLRAAPSTAATSPGDACGRKSEIDEILMDQDSLAG